MTEFWKAIPPNEPYRVLLGEVRNRLYQTRERSRHLLAHGYSDIPEEETFTNVEEVHILWLTFCLLRLLQTINVITTIDAIIASTVYEVCENLSRPA